MCIVCHCVAQLSPWLTLGDLFDGGHATNPGHSKFVHFRFWQEAFVKLPEGGEEKAHWAMPASGAGDELSCLVALDETETAAP